MDLKSRTTLCAYSLITLGFVSGIAEAADSDMFGVNFSTGDVFSIDPETATATSVGALPSGVTGFAFAPDGRLFGITDGISGNLILVDPSDWSHTIVGRLGAGITFEGGLAIDVNGRAVGGTRLAGGDRALFEIDLSTGVSTPAVALSRDSIDLNGFVFRDDGALVGIDANSNEFVSIDLDSGLVSTVAPLITPNAGAVGGMATIDGLGLYVTAGVVSGADGDNSLYTLGLYTGAQSLIGSLGPDAGVNFGISGLAAMRIPAPTTLLPFVAGFGGLSIRRRRNALSVMAGPEVNHSERFCN